MTSRNSSQDLVRHTFKLILAVAIAGATSALIGCATPSGAGRVALEPLGPGHVFPSIEAAVVDAMAFSVVETKRKDLKYRMAGGAITAVEGGYTYDEPVVAPALNPLTIRYRLGRDAVARYHVYPEVRTLRARREHDRGTAADRASVDREDPAHRPLYILTPSLVVKTYRGEASAIPMESIAQLDKTRGIVTEEMLASSSH